MSNFNVVYNKEDYLRHMALICPAGYQVDNDGFFYKKESNREMLLSIQSSLYFPDSARYAGGGGL